MRVLVVNRGSSSLKLRVLNGEDEVTAHADLPAVGGLDEDEVRAAVACLGPFEAVGHRVVHGGRKYTEPTRLDQTVRDELEALTSLAPLHQPPALAAIDLVETIAPGVPTIACFDTAFHAGLAPDASTYALPRPWRDDLGVRKYGFHGLAHAWTSRRADQMLGPTAGAWRIVTCHLGSGASLAAVIDGRSVDTTMGFTPLDGLVMATRCGSVDPGLVLWLQTHASLTAVEVSHGLEHGSGLLGLTGTPDMRHVVLRSLAGDPNATLALGVYGHRLRAGIAAMAAATEGIDALVFSGGVGEHCAPIRRLATTGLGFLGVTVDDEANNTATADAEITGPGHVRVLVVAAREDIEIARSVRSCLGQ